MVYHRLRPRPDRPDGYADGRRPADGKFAHVYAALDLGTNNCRLLIARPTAEAFRVVDAFSRIVRLGERLSATGELGPAAMDRAVEALRICAAKLRRRNVTRFRGVATEACRRASNGGEFLGRVASETGIELEVIAPAEEAALALSSCAQLLDPAIPCALLFDIGGGSTEVMWAARGADGRPQVIDAASMACGVVGFAERFGGDRISPESYEAMVSEVMDGLRDFAQRHGIPEEIARRRVQMIGTSGTVTTLAGIQLKLPRYDRTQVDGTYLTFDEVTAASRALAELDWNGRAAHPCIGNERADLVVAGCAILEAICRLCPVGRLRVADRGLREGILLGLMQAAEREAAAPRA